MRGSRRHPVALVPPTSSQRERLDVYGGVYFHPLDNLAFTFIQTVVPFFVLGVRPEAAVIAGFVALFYALFQHANVRTPCCLGYFIQPPRVAQRPSRPRRARVQLRRPPALGHRVWHVQEPRALRGRDRLLRRRVLAHRRDAPRPRCRDACAAVARDEPRRRACTEHASLTRASGTGEPVRVRRSGHERRAVLSPSPTERSRGRRLGVFHRGRAAPRHRHECPETSPFHRFLALIHRFLETWWCPLAPGWWMLWPSSG